MSTKSAWKIREIRKDDANHEEEKAEDGDDDMIKIRNMDKES
jgi:hypothetical protein